MIRVLPPLLRVGLLQLVPPPLEQRGLAGQLAGRRASHAAAQCRPQHLPELPEVW